ncbi:MAG: hypothetical protein PHQ40_14210 [Anaerolineaceae bacterium]|nr:hypothetical protein [Anaerolineaceae bacterium]
MAAIELALHQTNIKRSGDLFIMMTSLLLVFFMAVRIPLDTDLWWHLSAGKETLASGHVLLTDLFSYTRYGATWHNHSWLAEVILYSLFAKGGYLALGSLVALLATASIGLVSLQLEGPAILRAAVLLLAAIVESWLWSPRPQLFSLVILALVAYLLYLYKWKRVDRLWLLPLIFILWSNIHAGYTLGFILIGAVLIGEVINHIPGYPCAGQLPWKPILLLGLWGLVSGLLVVINPNGFNTWLVPFQTIRIQALQQYIAEWASPDFHQIGQQSMLWLLFACIAAISLSRMRIDGTDLVSFTLFGYLAFISYRNLAPFAIVASPILARYGWSAIKGFGERAHRTIQGRRVRFLRLQEIGRKELPDIARKVINLSFTGVILAAALTRLYFVAYPPMIAPQLTEMFPVGAVNWIREEKPPGRLFNSYNWGGYLEWNLPEYPVFVDGRTDLYNDEIIGQWMNIVNLGEGWQATLDRWNIRLILLEPGRPVVGALAQNGWRLFYSDSTSVVYGR